MEGSNGRMSIWLLMRSRAAPGLAAARARCTHHRVNTSSALGAIVLMSASVSHVRSVSLA